MDTGRKTYTQSTPTLALLQIWSNCQVLCTIEEWYVRQTDSKILANQCQYLMVDVVTNHMGYAGCGDCVDYSVFDPFDKESYYHPFCLIDYNNQTSMELVSRLRNSLGDLLTKK